MTAHEISVRSSVQIYKAEKNALKPVHFVSGCIVRYHDNMFLLSVSPAASGNGLATYLETNRPHAKGTNWLKPVGGFTNFDMFRIFSSPDIAGFEKLVEDAEDKLYLTYTQLPGEVELEQPAIDFGFLKIKKGNKIVLDLNHATSPDRENLYSFYGKIKPNYADNRLHMTPALKHNLKFHSSTGYFHKFLAPEIISDKDDSTGFTGAPIVDSDGRIVALVCKVVPNTKLVYGLSIHQCIELLS